MIYHWYTDIGFHSIEYETRSDKKKKKPMAEQTNGCNYCVPNRVPPADFYYELRSWILSFENEKFRPFLLKIAIFLSAIFRLFVFGIPSDSIRTNGYFSAAVFYVY